MINGYWELNDSNRSGYCDVCQTSSSCLGIDSGVRDFRGNVTTRPFQGEQAGSLRDFNPIREALIWAQSNSDLEEYAGKEVRQEELLSA
jgi:hypothetical protein